MTPLYLIDTSAWIFALGHQPVLEIRDRVRHLLDQNLAAVTSPILFELLSSTKTGHSSRQLQSYLLSLHPFPFLEEEWIKAADWTRSLRKKGLSVKTMDALIAYKAIQHNLIVLHADKDFDRIANKTSLKVESCVETARKATPKPD